MTAPPRLRFAPSPTGYLHVGGARTALFNWLYARRHGGIFVLRIEDTDVERSAGEMVTGILDGLRWLGLDWDEGPDVGGPHAPYYQSQRQERCRAMARRLVDEGHAYYCYCSPERLRQQREEAKRRGSAAIYDRRCCRLETAERARLEASGAPRAIRFKVPDGRTRFHDIVHGDIEVDHEHVEDFVLLRSDGHPTYQLSVVVDDLDMEITHIVRGDDHISNTPKQVLLYRAFGATLPQFAHVPLILGPDKKRLSKRHGATSVAEYRRLGYLSEAMVNFLALLGWSPGSDQELLTREELIRLFSLEGISGTRAAFDVDKLDWFSAQHLQRLPTADIATRIQPFLQGAGLWRGDYAADHRDWLHRVIELLRARSKRLADFVEYGQPFFADAVTYAPDAVEKYLSADGLADQVAALRSALGGVEPFDQASVETCLRTVAAARGIKAAVLIHAARVAVTGQAVSPGLFEVLEVLGRPRTVARLEQLERFLRSAPRAEGRTRNAE